MLQILLHSSKTMRRARVNHEPLDEPQFFVAAAALAEILQNHLDQLGAMMRLSDAKAAEVRELYEAWSLDPESTIPAIDAFQGDIYSGLQVQAWTEADRRYAHQRLRILSGLYGALRAGDGIRPYRLEMGYTLPTGVSMYEFWGDRLAAAVSPDATELVNLSAAEYTRALLPHINLPVITPKFLTVSAKTNQPTFVTVHAKIARGAFAHWMIKQRIEDTAKLHEFACLGYRYDETLSSSQQPVFVCQAFQGLGLSIRTQR